MDPNTAAPDPDQPSAPVPSAPTPPVAPVPPAPAVQPELPKAPPAVDVTNPANGAWPGAFAAVGQAFALIKKNPKPLLVFIVISVVLAIIDRVTGGSSTSLKGGVYSSHTTFSSLSFLILLMASPIYALSIADHKVISLGEVFQINVKKYLFLFLGAIIVGVIWALSSVALLIPLIWTVPWFIFFTYVIVDKDMGPIEAMTESKRLAKDHRAKVWNIIGVAILLAIANIIISLIPIFGDAFSEFTSVLISCALAILYRWLQKSAGDVVPASAGTSAPIAPVPPQAPVPPAAPTS